jgi:hypothetical protein
MFFSASSASAALIVVLLALVFLTFHLPYLPSSLEDLDSINFALGVRQFDVAHHQPHPPGYPVFIAAGKIVHVFVRDEAKALALISVLGGALGVVAIGMLFRRLDGGRRSDQWTLAATAVAMTAPLYWFTAARPLSDAVGLAAALAIQAITVSAATARPLAAAAFCAGLASGIRSQVFWLTVPLLIVTGFGIRDSGFARTVQGPRSVAVALAAFAAGALVWFVPLVVVTGGPAAYWHALSNQGAEDLGNITMLWTTHSVRAAADALYYALVAPWATWTVAIVVLVFAAMGVVWLWRDNRRALALVAAAFGPYLVFDLLFQETFTSRYALPLVVPMAFLAVAGTRVLPRGSGVLAAVAIALFDAHVGGTSIAAYSRHKAPAFRLLDDMREAARSTTPVIAMDRRNSFDFRRPLVWESGALPASTRTLAAPPQHEWLEPVKYWNGGGRAPVWFVVDPKRAAIDLVQHGDPARYRWPLPYPVLVGGARPDEMDWYRVDRPEWYVGEGWSLTPEAAGVANADKRGLAYGPIHAGVSQLGYGGLMIGGRSFDPTLRPQLTAMLDGHVVLEESLKPGPFLRFVPGFSSGAEYMALTITTTPRAPVAIEQFDASARRLLFGFADGWHEQEFNPVTGIRWRWLSERGEVTFGNPPGEGPLISTLPRHAFALHLEGESPRRYFSRGSRLVVRFRGSVVFDRVLDDDFSIDVPIDIRIGDAPQPIVFETDQIYVPAERSRRTQDRRHLGLRIFTCELR